jgi:aminobenzoyl-glutamate transport protein
VPENGILRDAETGSVLYSPFLHGIVTFIFLGGLLAGLGTVIATMLPYSVAFLVGWMVLLVVWMLLGLPLGPGAALYL